jgi:glutamyl-tRNA reductase
MAEISSVESIITSEVEHFAEWERSTDFAPTAAALVARADLIRQVELERMRKTIDGMTDEQRSAVDHLSRRIVSKILHTPLSKAKELTNTKQAYLYLTALRELFELDDDDSA